MAKAGESMSMARRAMYSESERNDLLAYQYSGNILAATAMAGESRPSILACREGEYGESVIASGGSIQ
jgi:hypothetical protein